MNILAEIPSIQIFNSVIIFLAVGTGVFLGSHPFLEWVRRKESDYAYILGNVLLMQIPARAVTVAMFISMVLLGGAGAIIFRGNIWGILLCSLGGLFLPNTIIKTLRRKRELKLENQLVPAVRSLASAVRAGLNLVQGMQMLAKEAPNPTRQEFAHLIGEYEYGVPLEEAMDNAADRIGLSDYRLLLSALHTHRQRGGDLGETLDRIAESIREIQRLEKKVRIETSRGRTTARWLGAMPAVMLGMLYFIDPPGVVSLFTEPLGNMILAIVLVLNLIGFLWIRKILSLEI